MSSTGHSAHTPRTCCAVLAATVVSVLGLMSGCGAKPPDSAEGATSELLLLFAPEEALVGTPNVFEVVVRPSSAQPVTRGGDLPQSGTTVRIGDLPTDNTVTLEMGLYRNKIGPETKTHTCQGDGPFALKAGETASVNVGCTPIANIPGSGPVKVFVKVARASLTVSEVDPGPILAARDFAAPLLLAHKDDKERRVSLRQDGNVLRLTIDGVVTYLGPVQPAGTSDQTAAPLVRLVAGESLALQAVEGRSLTAVPSEATLRLSGSPLLFESTPRTLGIVLPFSLVNSDGTVTAAGRLFEEANGIEFTVAAYNVENLFDQTDEARNATYGDYRITPNDQGQVSNWGAPVTFQGQTMSWTDVKVKGIRRVLEGIDPRGPEIVSFEEIESRVAFDRLFTELKELGYVAGQFTDWPASGTLPAIGAGIISKFPILDWSLVQPVIPPGAPSDNKDPLRPILRVRVAVQGKPLLVYVNHWKSKSGPESLRKLSAEALAADLKAVQTAEPAVDYVIVGDLNCDYNEKSVLSQANNDTGGLTGINDILRAQGDEVAVARNRTPGLKYNLHYELDRSMRRTAFYPEFGWSTFDHMLVGTSAFDQLGVTYVDNSFQVADRAMPRLRFLFDADGVPVRWREVRESDKVTRHEVGGFSDHLPIWARFRVAPKQQPGSIWLVNPGRPDVSDVPLAP